MTLISSLSEQSSMVDVMTIFNEPMRHLNSFAESIMRGSSSLTEAERELIAAYVSGLNGCSYCLGVHSSTAIEFGINIDVFEALMVNISSAPIDYRLKPLLHYVRKLTLSPSKMVQADAENVHAVGWDEKTLFNAIAICGYFNLMNRIVEGCGLVGNFGIHKTNGNRLATKGYIPT